LAGLYPSRFFPRSLPVRETTVSYAFEIESLDLTAKFTIEASISRPVKPTRDDPGEGPIVDIVSIDTEELLCFLPSGKSQEIRLDQAGKKVLADSFRAEIDRNAGLREEIEELLFEESNYRPEPD
jgi:hypothetical protein